MLRIPHWLDSWLTDGSEVVSHMHQQHSILRNIFLFSSLVLISIKRQSKPQALVHPEGLDKLIKFDYLIGS
jgi:hypothetical protein